MKENKYARDKKNNLIYLNEDGKLQEVMLLNKSNVKSSASSFFLSPLMNSTVFARLVTLVCLSRLPINRTIVCQFIIGSTISVVVCFLFGT